MNIGMKYIFRLALKYGTKRSLFLGLYIISTYTGRSPGHAVGMAGCGHSKIARLARVVFVFVLYVAMLPSLQFLTVTKTVTSRKL